VRSSRVARGGRRGRRRVGQRQSVVGAGGLSVVLELPANRGAASPAGTEGRSSLLSSSRRSSSLPSSSRLSPALPGQRRPGHPADLAAPATNGSHFVGYVRKSDCQSCDPPAKRHPDPPPHRRMAVTLLAISEKVTANRATRRRDARHPRRHCHGTRSQGEASEMPPPAQRWIEIVRCA
jgi:hypothetical protein